MPPGIQNQPNSIEELFFFSEDKKKSYQSDQRTGKYLNVNSPASLSFLKSNMPTQVEKDSERHQVRQGKYE